MLGWKYSAANRLFHWLSIKTNLAETQTDMDIVDFILVELNYLSVSPIFLDKPIPIFTNKYLEYL